MEIKSKLWIEVDGEPVFGRGRRFLLQAIDKYGSINQVAKEINISYPILGIPACGMYHKTTIFDLVLPRVLDGEKIGRAELAELGHGGLCLNCKECMYPVCPFGK